MFSLGDFKTALSDYSTIYSIVLYPIISKPTRISYVDATNFITSSLDNTIDSTIGTFIDLEKTFDIVDHGILLNKFYFYGMRIISGEIIPLESLSICLRTTISYKERIAYGLTEGPDLGATTQF